MTPSVQRLLSLLLAGSWLLSQTPVWAEVTPQDRAAARVLFNEARKLAALGRLSEACPKFEESQSLDPGVGTQFNLADCYEKSHRYASAWSLFLDVAARTKAANQPAREKASRKRAQALEPKLSHLTVQVPEPNVLPGLVVLRDGVEVGRAQWGVTVPVDGGEHRIEASAPGHQKWSSTVQVQESADSVSVSVPQLEPLAAPAPPPVKPPEVAPGPTEEQKAEAERIRARRKTHQIAAVGLGAVGAVGLGLGTYFALKSRSNLNDADAYCSGSHCWDQRGVDLHDDALHNADRATIAVGVGAAALIGGAILYWTAPKPKELGSEPSTGVTATVGMGPQWLGVSGQW